MNFETLRDFLGWCTLLNFGLLLLMTFALMGCRRPVARLHARWFGFSESVLSIEFYRFLAHYKMAVLLFNLVPYLALRIVG